MKPQRRKQRLILPTELEGTTDRNEWSAKIGEFYRRLYDNEDEGGEGEGFPASGHRWQACSPRSPTKNLVQP